MLATAAAAARPRNQFSWIFDARAAPPSRNSGALRVRVEVYIRSLLFPRSINRSFKLPTEIRPHHCYRDDPVHSQEDTPTPRLLAFPKEDHPLRRRRAVAYSRFDLQPPRRPSNTLTYIQLISEKRRNLRIAGKNRRNTSKARAAPSSILYTRFPPTFSIPLGIRDRLISTLYLM